MANKDCRRCGECVGQEHHWIDPGVCKHCEAFQCSASEDLDEPCNNAAAFIEDGGGELVCVECAKQWSPDGGDKAPLVPIDTERGREAIVAVFGEDPDGE